jgi:chromosome segregation ATPase
VFVKSAIIKGLVKIGLAPISHLVRAEHERNQAIKERDQAVAEREDVGGGKFDKFPAALFAAEAERDALRKQRDQAYGEIDDLCRECNELKGQLERLIAAGPAPGVVTDPCVQGHGPDRGSRSSHCTPGTA